MAANLGEHVAFVTGAGSGIGRASALAFASAGADVFVADINAQGADETTTRIHQRGGRATSIQLDVTDAKAVAACFERVASAGKAADIVMNCAGGAGGGGGDGPVSTLDEDAWQRILDVNLKGTYLVCKYAIPPMIERGGGSIINVASRAAINGIPLHAYSAAKGGVASLSRSIGVTYARHNIRCNSLAPGPIETPLTASWMSDEAEKAKRLEAVPAKRAGQPSEVASLALFLASDEASYITATVIPIDGGASAI